MLQSLGWQRVRHNLATEQQQKLAKQSPRSNSRGGALTALLDEKSLEELGLGSVLENCYSQ